MKTIQEILKKHNVYTLEVELALLENEQKVINNIFLDVFKTLAKEEPKKLKGTKDE